MALIDRPFVKVYLSVHQTCLWNARLTVLCSPEARAALGSYPKGQGPLKRLGVVLSSNVCDTAIEGLLLKKGEHTWGRPFGSWCGKRVSTSTCSARRTRNGSSTRAVCWSSMCVNLGRSPGPARFLARATSPAVN